MQSSWRDHLHQDLRPLFSVAGGAALVVDAMYLMAQRLFSLGVLLPLVMGCGLLWLGLRWPQVNGWVAARPQRARLWRWAWTAFAAWLASVGVFWMFLAQAAKPTTSVQAPAAIIVLGSGTPGGKVSPVLAARLDTALAEVLRHPDALVLVSGGIDFGESVSEGRLMGDYLRARGLAPARIVQEEKSTSTEQNLLFSLPALRQRGIAPSAPIELVTSDFHTLRASWIARKAGYGDVTPVGAPTPLYIRYNAWLREYFAVISGFILREFA